MTFQWIRVDGLSFGIKSMVWAKCKVQYGTISILLIKRRWIIFQTHCYSNVPLFWKTLVTDYFKLFYIADYIAEHHIAYEPLSSIWGLNFLDEYAFYMFYPPFNHLPAMFCGTLGGAKMTNYMKRSSRWDECEGKNTRVQTPHRYFSSEVWCHKDFVRLYLRHIVHRLNQGPTSDRYPWL